ncbi:MAG: diguanylate cyclase [Deltaproteobacteria bacterium]|nr:diguanylate cyclase [Deltaproteobacteria bacterium]
MQPTTTERAAPTVASPSFGLAIPGLELIELIGQGAFSFVYRARRGDEVVAVKILRDPAAKHEARRRVWREASALARIRHPNLCEIRTVGEINERPYIVMEFIQGRTLADEIGEHPLGEQHARDIALKVADAIARVHNAGLVHGDLKPQNILLSQEGEPKIIDFGLVTGSALKEATAATFGTLLYASPEQLGMLKRPIDARSDLYSLGVVLYQMLTGRTPFVTTEVAELVRQHATVVPEPVHALNPAVSASMSEIVARLLAKDPDERYATGIDLSRALSSRPKRSAASESVRSAVVVGNDGEQPSKYTAGDLPLKGVEAAADQLVDLWHRARAGKGATVIISGPAGSGKSRLARELKRTVDDEGRLVLSAKCSPNDPTPLSVFRQLIDDLVSQARACPDPAAMRELIAESIGLGGMFLRRVCPEISAVVPNLPAISDEAQIQDSLNRAAVELLIGLAKNLRGMVVAIDDAHWIDSSTRTILSRLDEDLGQTPLLLLATVRTGPEHAEAAEHFATSVKTNLNPVVSTLPLGPLAVRELVQDFLQTDDIASELVDRIVARSGGNPLSALEHVQALLEEGVLRFEWGRWILQAEGIERLELPDRILDLIVRRLNALGPEALSVLSVAALLGARFDREILRNVVPEEEISIDEALVMATSAQVIESLGRGKYAFLHDRLREGLVAALDEEMRPALHRRIAQALDKEHLKPHLTSSWGDLAHDAVNVFGLDAFVEEAPAEFIYGVAHHYYAGRSPSIDQRAFEANWMAGKKAHGDYAFEQAALFLARADEIRRSRSDLVAPAAFFADCGLTHFATWRADAAAASFEAALATSSPSDTLLRARCQLELAKLESINADRSIEYLSGALRNLGASYPAPSLYRVLATLSSWIWGVWRPLPPVPASDLEALARTRLICECYTFAGYLEFYCQRPIGMVLGPLLAQKHVRRLQLSSHRAKWFGSISAMLSVLRAKRLAARFRETGISIAKTIGDPATIGATYINAGYSLDFAGCPASAQAAYEASLEHYGKWMSPWDRRAGVATLLSNLYMRGLSHRCARWGAHLLHDTGADDSRVLSTALTAPAEVLLGRYVSSATSRDDFDPTRAAEEWDALGQWMQALVLGYSALRLLVSDGPRDLIEPLLSKFLSLKVDLRSNHQLHQFSIAETWIRIEQLESASLADRRACRKRYLASLKRLKRGAHHPSIRAHVLAVEARRAALEGRARAFRRASIEAERVANMEDNPWVLFEVSRLRAEHAVRTRSRYLADSEADRAADLASLQGWSARLESVQRRFELSGLSSKSSSQMSSTQSSPVRTSGLQVSRSLAALQEVSLAFTTALEPAKQTRLVLDEIVRLMAAERALLFLCDAAGAEELRFEAGRTKEGDEVLEDAGYGASIVAEVARTRAPVVVGGAGNQRLRVSESVVIHNLRSIMAVPLLLHERLIGVVYVDNRLARGMFTEDDVAVFSAIASRVAIALETSRTVRLETELEAERAQKNLAQRLRTVVASLGSSLELQEVLAHILDELTHLIPYRKAAVLLTAEAGLRLAAHRGFKAQDLESEDLESERPESEGPESEGPESESLDPEDLPAAPKPSASSGLSTSRDIVGARDLVVLRERFPYPHRQEGEVGQQLLLGLPLIVRDEVLGLLTVEIDGREEVTEHKAQVARIFAGHAAIAVENARLFEEIREQATTDALTGLSTRRQFFALGERQLHLARRQGCAVFVLMTDIDFFKKINDTYGHATGDEVLIETSRRLRSVFRESDILGRYGGEEFAAVLGESSLEAARSTAERIRSVLAEQPIETAQGPVPVTLSVGLASSNAAAAGTGRDDLQAVLQVADQALYRAKERGRNRVVVADGS